MYHYRAKVTRVVDGDTIKASVDCGFDVTVNSTFRLFGINTPEIRGEEKERGLMVKKYVADLIEGKEVELVSYKGDKYGRWLATVYINNKSLNDELLNLGYAERMVY
jgi:micrococcal nuclease